MYLAPARGATTGHAQQRPKCSGTPCGCQDNSQTLGPTQACGAPRDTAGGTPDAIPERLPSLACSRRGSLYLDGHPALYQEGPLVTVLFCLPPSTTPTPLSPASSFL